MHIVCATSADFRLFTVLFVDCTVSLCVGMSKKFFQALSCKCIVPVLKRFINTKLIVIPFGKNVLEMTLFLFSPSFFFINLTSPWYFALFLDEYLGWKQCLCSIYQFFWIRGSSLWITLKFDMLVSIHQAFSSCLYYKFWDAWDLLLISIGN